MCLGRWWCGGGAAVVDGVVMVQQMWLVMVQQPLNPAANGDIDTRIKLQTRAGRAVTN